jgi:hypothetical protein
MEEKNRRRRINGNVKRCYSSCLYPFIKLAYGQIYNDDITVCSPPWLLSSWAERIGRGGVVVPTSVSEMVMPTYLSV